MNRIIDNMDFDGARAFKIVDLMEKKEKSIDAWVVDAENEGAGSTCVGMSLILLRNINEGALAVERNDLNEFHHAAVIVECDDGVVFIDNRSVPEFRLFSIPYGGKYEGDGFSITAAPKGKQPPLTIHGPAGDLEYYTHIANGVNLRVEAIYEACYYGIYSHCGLQ